jgi:predicted enzyme related to lactoylglutathione lyase
MILGLRTVIYPVNDLSKAKEWYSYVIATKPYFDQPFYVGFQVGGFELGLLPEGKPSINGAQAMWGVVNAEVEYKRLLELGAQSIQEVTDVGEGIKVASLKDPFGNRFGIIENPNFNPKEIS